MKLWAGQTVSQLALVAMAWPSRWGASAPWWGPSPPVTPAELQGRMNATVRTVTWGTVPLAAAAGGVLAARYGLLQAVLIGAVLNAFCIPWLLAGRSR